MTDSPKQETKANTAFLDQAIEIFTKRMNLDGNEIMRDAKRAAMQEVFHFFQTNQVSENLKPYDANSASAFWKGIKSGGNETLISDCGVHTADIDLPDPRPGRKDSVWMGKIQCHGSTEAEAIELRDAVLHAIESQHEAQPTQSAELTDERIFDVLKQIDPEAKRLPLGMSKFARGIFALRPVQVPMTSDEIANACNEVQAHSILSFMKGVRAAEAHHFGITAQVKDGGAA